jgi:hypothetical protein
MRAMLFLNVAIQNDDGLLGPPFMFCGVEKTSIQSFEVSASSRP